MKPEIRKECVVPLLDKRFIRVYDLQYAPGKHYFDATRRSLDDLAAVKTDEELRNEITWLIPTAQKNEMEPIMVTIEPGGSTYPDNPHEGEEFGLVLNGSLSLMDGGKEQKLRRGDTFYIRGDREHHLANRTSSPAQVLWITTPPSF